MSKKEEFSSNIHSYENLTIEKWKEVSKNWHPATVFMAKEASNRSFENRQKIVKNVDLQLLFGLYGEDSNVIEYYQKIWALSDEALSRLTQALSINEMEGRYQISGKAE